MNASKVLAALWPSGIAVSEYDRVVEVIHALGGVTPKTDSGIEARTPRPRRKLDMSAEARIARREKWLAGKVVSDAKINAVIEMVRQQPCTVKQISAAVGLSSSSVDWVRHKYGFVRAGRTKPTSANRQSAILWRLPAVPALHLQAVAP